MSAVADLAWCDECHGPIVRKTKIAMCWDYLGFVIALHWPHHFFASWPHLAVLPYAGSHAYTCTCWPKIAYAQDGAA